MDRFVTDLARFAATGSFGDFSAGARLTELVAAKGDPDPAHWPLHQASTYGLNHGACPEPGPGPADDGHGA